MSTNRNVQAKNRAPASIQITAEQILREAKDRQLDVEVKAPRQQITDEEELRVFRMRKRKEVCLCSLRGDLMLRWPGQLRRALRGQFSRSFSRDSFTSGTAAAQAVRVCLATARLRRRIDGSACRHEDAVFCALVVVCCRINNTGWPSLSVLLCGQSLVPTTCCRLVGAAILRQL